MSERASGAGLRLTLTIDLPPDGTPAREALNRRTIGELLGIEPKRSARVSGSVILRDEDGGEIPAARTAPEPWTPKPGDRVRIDSGGEDGTFEYFGASSPEWGWVKVRGCSRRLPIDWLRPHAEPAPDPRDAEIEQLHKEREAAMAEVSRLKADPPKPAAVPLSPDERERLAHRVRECLTGQPGESWSWLPRHVRNGYLRAVEIVAEELARRGRAD